MKLTLWLYRWMRTLKWCQGPRLLPQRSQQILAVFWNIALPLWLLCPWWDPLQCLCNKKIVKWLNLELHFVLWQEKNRAESRFTNGRWNYARFWQRFWKIYRQIPAVFWNIVPPYVIWLHYPWWDPLQCLWNLKNR